MSGSTQPALDPGAERVTADAVAVMQRGQRAGVQERIWQASKLEAGRLHAVPQQRASHRFAEAADRPTGSALLSAEDVARTLSDVLGRSVRHFEMPMWMFLKALRVLGPRLGTDAFQQTALRHHIEAHKLGACERGAPTDHVKLTTGREPEDFATIARRYAARPEASEAQRISSWPSPTS